MLTNKKYHSLMQRGTGNLLRNGRLKQQQTDHCRYLRLIRQLETEADKQLPLFSAEQTAEE